MKITLTTLLVFILFQAGNGQSFECGTDLVHKIRMQNDPAYREQFLKVEAEVESTINNGMNFRTSGTVYNIPVVVHIIHLGEPIGTGTNISDAQVHRAIAGLNSRWANATGNGVDFEVRFCLADRDVNGNPTSGINRVNGSVLPRYATHGISIIYNNCDAPSEDSVKSLSRWPTARYYNIWVVNKLCQNFGGFVGYALYPNGNADDGTIIQYNYMDSANTTLAHELGHGFFLYHTFEGGSTTCPADTNCLTNGDKVCDTPPHKQSDCGSSNPCTTAGIWSNSLYNYMSYCGPLNRFTQGQKDRVRATAINYPRLPLLTSTGCSSVAGLPTIAGNAAFSIIPNPATGVFQINFNEVIVKGRIIIYNSMGGKVAEENINALSGKEINLEHATPGIYFITVDDNATLRHQKIIIQ